MTAGIAWAGGATDHAARTVLETAASIRRHFGRWDFRWLCDGLAAIGAVLLPCFEAILDSGPVDIDLDPMLRGADRVIAAEGAIDFQAPMGKIPAELARWVSIHGIPTVALVGNLGRGCRDVHDIGIDASASTVPIPMTLHEVVDDAELLQIEASERFVGTIIPGGSTEVRQLSAPDSW